MDLESAWAVAAKDFKIFRRKRSVIYSSIIFPIIIGVVFPLILDYSIIRNKNGGVTAPVIVTLMDTFSIWFLIGAATIPNAISSYSMVGEKVQKSLEPLLATPMTDGEILLGKIISGLLIPVAAIYAGSTLFMVLMDQFTRAKLGYLYYPNWLIGAILLAVPLVSLMAVELSVIISSRMNDVRTAQQLGTLLIVPFVGLFFLSDIGLFPLNDNNLLILAGVLVIVDVILFFASRATFQREQILTKWK
jgi:ABC-2 type transport system permease protein